MKNRINKKSRNSNVELLRIISMLLIVSFHCVCHNGLRTYDNMPFIYISSVLLGSWGIFGVDVFVIISAYYLVEQRFRITKVIHILFQTFTYLTGFALLSIAYITYTEHSFFYAVKRVVIHFWDGFWEPLWSDHYWFVTSYLLMLIVSPFLNLLIERASKDLYKKLLIILLFVPIYAQFGNSYVADTMNFCYIYFLVGYIKKYGINFFDRMAKVKYVLIISLCIVASNILLYFWRPKFVKDLLINTIGNTGRNSLIILFLSLIMFLVVIKQQQFNNTIINSVASYTFGIYLFHGYGVYGWFKYSGDFIFQKLFEIGIVNKDYLFPFRFMGAVIIIFFTGLAIEFIRNNTIQRPVMRLLSKKFWSLFYKIDAWFIC